MLAVRFMYIVYVYVYIQCTLSGVSVCANVV